MPNVTTETDPTLATQPAGQTEAPQAPEVSEQEDPTADISDAEVETLMRLTLPESLLSQLSEDEFAELRQACRGAIADTRKRGESFADYVAGLGDGDDERGSEREDDGMLGRVVKAAAGDTPYILITLEDVGPVPEALLEAHPELAAKARAAAEACEHAGEPDHGVHIVGTMLSIRSSMPSKEARQIIAGLAEGIEVVHGDESQDDEGGEDAGYAETRVPEGQQPADNGPEPATA